MKDTVEVSAADAQEFYERMEDEDWDWLQKRFRENHPVTAFPGFLHQLVLREAPAAFVKEVVQKDPEKLLEACEISLDPEEPSHNLTPVVIASTTSSNDLFHMLLEQTKEQVHVYELFNMECYGPASVFTDIGIIPFDKLRALFEAFPYGLYGEDDEPPTREYMEPEERKSLHRQRIKEYLLSRDEEEDEGIEKYMYVLQRIVGSNFLVPHALLATFLGEPFDSETPDGDKTDALEMKLEFLSSCKPILEFILSSVPKHFKITDMRGQLPIHVFLSNLDYRYTDGREYPDDKKWTLPKNSHLQKICQFLLDNNEDGARVPNQDGRLALHIACENGAQFLGPILKAYLDAVRVRCPTTHLYPFQLAATSHIRSMHPPAKRDALAIERTFMLLKLAPDLVLPTS